eukprot:6844965-Prymnesium_polylepis.1
MPHALCFPRCIAAGDEVPRSPFYYVIQGEYRVREEDVQHNAGAFVLGGPAVRAPAHAATTVSAR